MKKEEALLIFELMGSNGAESRLEAYGVLVHALEPDLFLTEGEKVEQARQSVSRKYGVWLNRFGDTKHIDGGGLIGKFIGNMDGDYLFGQRTIVLPHVRGGTYTAEVSVETNPKNVVHGHRPTWNEGELLVITINSREFISEEDNYKFEIVMDEKNGGVVYINEGSSESLDLGDYQVLEYLLEDIDR